jgi:hypothetical protein
MDRVETLLHKLQQQIQQHAPIHEALVTVQMMQHELLHLQKQQPTVIATNAIALNMPILETAQPIYTPTEIEPTSLVNNNNQNDNLPTKNEIEEAIIATPITPVETEEKIIEVLQVDEAEIEAELEEIKRNAASIQQFSTISKPQLLFDLGEDDIPTLAQKPYQASPIKEINDQITPSTNTASVNDILKEQKTELSDKLSETAIKDLKKAIGINDRFLYINELFRGDEVMYERSIKTINSFAIWPEAEYWIRRELKIKLGWNDKDATVQQFDQLVKRRFS